MHALVSSAAIFLLYLVSTAISYSTYPTASSIVQRTNELRKCCIVGYIFNKDYECVRVQSGRLDYTVQEIWRTVSFRYPRRLVAVSASTRNSNAYCRGDGDYCIENVINGTTVLMRCVDVGAKIMLNNDSTKTTVTLRTSIAAIITMATVTVVDTTTNASTGENRKAGTEKKHSNDLSMVYFWGAQTYMNTNVAHVVLCVIVVVVYLSFPELGKSVYNRAVLRHNICLLLLGCILMSLGYCELNDCPISEDFAVFLWIMLQYFTNATVFWLNVICFDMTLSITRFRWMVSSGRRTSQEENRRLLVYGIFAWGGALIPAIVAVILEFCPGIPKDFPLKPNYHRYREGPNLIINIYFFGIPLLPLFLNNVLFVFTTYKILRIQRSTEIATKNRNNALRKRYFLFLQLYLLMGAPWFFGSLLACLNMLVVLKMCRLIWPILWLLMLVGHRNLRQRFANKLQCVKKQREIAVCVINM